MTATPNLFYVYDFVGTNSESDDAVDFIPETGGSPTSEGTDVGDSAGVFSGLAIAAAAGVYFVTSDPAAVNNGHDTFIYEEHFGQAPQFTSPLGGGPAATGLDDDFTSLAINASDDILYFASGAGFYEEKFTGANFSGTPTKIELSVLPTSTDASTDQIAFDQADHSAYFAAPGYKVTFTTVNTAHGSKETTLASITRNFIYKVSGVTAGATANSLSNQVVNLGGPSGQLPFADGAITGVALDSATDTLLITTKAIQDTAASSDGIYAYNIGTGSLTALFSKADAAATGTFNDIEYITVDPTTGEYYISVGDKSNNPGIYEGNIANIGVAPTLLEALPGPTNGEASGDVIDALAIDPPPTVTGVAILSIDGAANKTTGAVTTADTVKINVTFSGSVFVTGTPSLALNDGGSASYLSGSGGSTLTFSYTPASGQNVATLASTGLTGGTISDSAGTAANLANASQTFTGLEVETTRPTLSVTGVTSDVVQGAATATTLLQSDSVTDVFSPGAIKSATISIASPQAGDELSIPGVSGGTLDGGKVAVTGLGTSTLTLTGDDSLAEYQTLLKSVTYQDAGSDTTTQGHPTRTVDWTVDDGVLASNTATSTVTIDRAPTVTAGATATFDGGQSSPTTLDPGLSITDLDHSNIASATVTVASGFVAGDTIDFTAQNGIAGQQSGNELKLTGTASAADYQAALESVAYSFTPSFDDPTDGGADTSRTLDWSVDDGLNVSPVATSTLNVVHEPPVLAASGTVTYKEIGPPVALDPTLSLSDPDSGFLLQSAAVEIASGFVAGDKLSADTTGVPSIIATYDSADGVLSLSGSDTVADYRAVLRSVTFNSTASDATQGGTDTSRNITWSVNDGVASNATTETSTVDVAPCFCRGARILTDRGEVAVEDLVVGDIAITSSRRRRPIVWIGHRRLDLTRHRDPAAVRPVRVRAGAFGERLPRRDLWLSPGHSVACEDTLTPISSLINGRSVVQVEQDRVEYWHVELDAHDILLVEGLPAESYLDCGNREAFENGGAFVEAHPDFRPKHWAATCLPLVKEGSVVEATRARLLARLTEQGHTIDQEADAHILVDGLKIEPVRVSETRLAFGLPAGGREIALCSKVFVPAHARADSADWRELGVCVGRLQIDGEAMTLGAGEAFEPGWHPAEFDGGRFARRWTRGAAALPSGARSVIVDLADFGQYWRDPQVSVTAALARGAPDSIGRRRDGVARQQRR